MKRILVCVIAIVVAVAFAATALLAYPQLSQKTGKPCTYCHKSPQGGKQLTSAGQYYKKNNKLPPAQAKPTTKPAAKPGAKPATKPAAKPTVKKTTSKAGAGKGPSMYGYKTTGKGPSYKQARMKTHRTRYSPLGTAPMK